MGIFRKKTSEESRETQRIEAERKFLLTYKHDFYLTEAYKTLRTNVTFSLIGESRCKVITVTSAMESEGKSITAANLAISFAEDGKKVLLVDCDLRKPKLGRLLESKASGGLTNVLLDPSTLIKNIQAQAGSKLNVLFAGNVPPNPSELLGSDRMKKLLESLRDCYDYIILDSPPVNMVTDAVILATQTDGVLFVVRAGQSERGALMHSLDQLNYVNAKVLGFVMNGTSNYAFTKYRRYKYYGKGYYGHRYGYRYGYGYGYGHKDSEQPPERV